MTDDLPRDGPTPRRVFRERAASERFAAVRAACDALSVPELTVVPAYSVKTNPRAELLALALRTGFLAETISPDEAAWARTCGFAPDTVVANGPDPVPVPADLPFAYAFADSVEAFARNLARGVAHVAGIRVRPAMLASSRFGVPVEDDALLAAAVAAAPADMPLAVSFHARRGDFRAASWRDVAGDVLERARALQAVTGRPIVAFDAGGGWTPQEFDETFAADGAWLAARLRALLPACTRLLIEPGQAIATPSEALLTRVVEVRERAGRREVIVDASYADWPQMHTYVHPILILREGRWVPVGAGADRLGGRTCLEYDTIDGLRFPPDLAEGDLLAILDTGSYDRSMAFAFARGGAVAEPLT